MKTKKKYEVVVFGYSEQLNRCLTEVLIKNVNYKPVKEFYKNYLNKIIDGKITFDFPVEVCLYKTLFVEEVDDYLPDDEPLMMSRINFIKPGRPRKENKVCQKD